jgi:Mrp family chromosome partitioning ATPase
MDPVEYLRGIKRRWRLVAAVVALSLIGAWVLTSVIGYGASKGSTSATTTLIQASERSSSGSSRSTTVSPSGTSNIQTIAALVTVDQVAAKAAKELKFVGDPKALAKKVKAQVDPKTGFLKITATAKEPERAKEIANTFSTQLLAFLIEREAQTNAAFAKALGDQIARVRKDIGGLDAQIKKYPAAAAAIKAAGSNGRDGGSGAVAANTGTPADPLIEQRNAALKQIGTLSAQLQEVKSRAADAHGLSVIQTAVADKTKFGTALPSSLAARLLIAAVLGLIGGLGLALIRERFDRRIRTKEAAERHFGFQVLAEVPALRRSALSRLRRSGSPAKLSSLPPAVVDAYRLLASSLLGSTRNNGGPPSNANKLKPRMILVTSAGPEDGRSSIVANLAATLAGVGKTVTVVSCDFRHPEIHHEFGVPDQRSLADALRTSNGGSILSSCLWQTPVSGVWVVPSGQATESDQLLSSPALRRLLMEARQLSDVVIVETAPILTSDATFLLPEVDGVLVAVRAGTTRPELAERSSELLKRLKAPVLGMVLTGHTEAALPHGYYRTWSPRRVILGAPGTILRGAGRGARAVGRALAAVGRIGRRGKKKAAVAPAGLTPIAPAAVVAIPEAGIEPKSTPNGQDLDHTAAVRGFPRLIRRSDTR